MKPTSNLRFVNRQINRDTYHILQQQWIDWDMLREGGATYEWRDVPTVDAEDGNP